MSRSIDSSGQNFDRMVKAKSDGSIASSGTVTETSQGSKLKSRSLEPLSTLVRTLKLDSHFTIRAFGVRNLGIMFQLCLKMRSFLGHVVRRSIDG